MTPSSRITMTLIAIVGVVPLMVLAGLFGAVLGLKIAADLLLMAWTVK